MTLFDNPRAFAPFFEDAVVFEAKRDAGRVVRTTVKACVIDMGLDDPLAESDSQGAYSKWSVRVHACDLFGVAPRLKDRVTLDGCRQLSVVDVWKDGQDYVLVARGPK